MFRASDQILNSKLTGYDQGRAIKNDARLPAPADPRSMHAEHAGTNAAAPAIKQRVVDTKVGRNEPCPCGSGKKHKHCCGR